jgi:transcriptional regulator with XRE-family HTH domain
MNIYHWSNEDMVEEWEKDLAEELKDPEFAKSYGSECAKSEFGLALFHARQVSNMTQQHLAEKIGVSQPYVAQLESGEANPTLSVAGKLMAVLGLKMCISLRPLELQIEPADSIAIYTVNGQNWGYGTWKLSGVDAAETNLGSIVAGTEIALPADQVYIRCVPVCAVEPQDILSLPEPSLFNFRESAKQPAPDLVTVGPHAIGGV